MADRHLQGSAVKDWVFTILFHVKAEDFTEAHLAEWYDRFGRFKAFAALGYHVEAVQRCPDTGRAHVQGFLQFAKRRRGTVFQHEAFLPDRDLIASTHQEKRRGSVDEAIAYIKDNEKGTNILTFPVVEEGTPSGQGASKPLQEFAEAVVRGDPLHELALTYPSVALLHGRKAAELKRLLLPPSPEWRDLRIRLHYGPPDSGKSRSAREAATGGYYAPPAGAAFWFDGYNGERRLVIDDYVGQWPLADVLRVLDGYSLQLPVKNGFVPALFTEVDVTSNIHPLAWYSWHGRSTQFPALLRRFGEFAFYSGVYGRRGHTVLRLERPIATDLFNSGWPFLLPLRSLFLLKKEQILDQLDQIGEDAYKYPDETEE